MNNPAPKSQIEGTIQFPYLLGKRKRLDRSYKSNTEPFLSVLNKRSSSSKFSKPDMSNISELLFHCASAKEIYEDDMGLTVIKRAVPSAGSIHPIDLLVSMPSESARELNYYNPIDHSLYEIMIDAVYTKEFFEEVSINKKLENACLIWFSIQPDKTGVKYNYPKSLYWRDTGALLLCVQLVATYLGLSSCPLGTLATKTFNNLFESQSLISGGGILIGKTSY